MLSRHQCEVGFAPKSLFTDENDHNPSVMPDCPRCHGTGRACEHLADADGAEVHAFDTCGDCGGAGHLPGAKPERMWPEGIEVIDVSANDAGWIRCPCCGKSFKESGQTWTGRRHRCGQKLRIIPTEKK